MCRAHLCIVNLYRGIPGNGLAKIPRGLGHAIRHRLRRFDGQWLQGLPFLPEHMHISKLCMLTLA
jgi:hypothetical protein